VISRDEYDIHSSLHDFLQPIRDEVINGRLDLAPGMEKIAWDKHQLNPVLSSQIKGLVAGAEHIEKP
jgi:hypothetical protein